MDIFSKSSSLADRIPDIYRNIVPQVFNVEIPREEFATCSSCAMAGKKEPLERWHGNGPLSFRGDLKCCTWYPTLPNYLVGGALTQCANPLGRQLISRTIARRLGVDPAAVSPPKSYTAIYEKAKGSGFGNSERLLCPYFERGSGSCAIWDYREAVCSTYHCKHVGGKLGKHVWGLIKQYLMEVQKALTKHCLLESDLSTKSFVLMDMEQRGADSSISSSEIDGEVDEIKYGRVWGNYAGREEEFYGLCFKVVRSVKSLDAILGVEQRANSLILEDAMDKLMFLPEVLVRSRPPQAVGRGVDSESVSLMDCDIVLNIDSALLASFEKPAAVKVVIRGRADAADMVQVRAVIWMLYRHGVLVKASS